MKQVFHKALARQVMAVLVLDASPDGSRGDFACYVDAVPGEQHEQELEPVVKAGIKQSALFAKAVFGDLVEILEGKGYFYRP